MQEEDLAKKQEEEVQYLNQRIKEIYEKEAKVPAKEARTIAEFVESKMKLLKTCYDNSNATVKESIHQLIRYPQLQCFMAKAETGEVTLEDDIVYSEKAVKIHIDKGTPKKHKNRAIEFYSFYFGRYRLFFRCFDRDFLKDIAKLDEEFIDDVFSPKDGDYYVYGERLEIAGVTIIDEAFIEEIKKQEFSMIEFYTAIKDSQWLGIVHNCYVERRGYEQLKNAVLESLNQKRQYKICGIVHGTGGSGKSTILRRLCLDIQKNENCTVIWINDVIQFYQDGLSAIKLDLETNNEKKYLIVIEDWYRMFHNNSETGSELLKQLHKHNNIRIVIGDRTIVGKPYENYGNDYNLLLSSNENKKIIQQIIKKYPDWQKASKRLFKSLSNDQPTLFLLLFILARISHENSDIISVNLSDPLVVFKNIIKSDLNFIAKREEKKYQGLAKALYYWACIYVEHKVFISYETFLKIADHYSEKNTTKVSGLFSRWNADDEILEKLKLYISRDKFGRIQFNHDILAEGISELNIDGWKKYGTQIKLDLLNVITGKGDDYSASVFLGSILSKEEKFIELEEKINCVRLLIDKGNRHNSYLNEFAKQELNDSVLIDFGQIFWDKKIFHSFFWEVYFRKIKENDKIISSNIDSILNKKHLSEYEPEFISIVVKNTDKVKKYKFINTLLDEFDINNDNIHPSIIYSCYFSSDKIEIKKKLSNIILKSENWKDLFSMELGSPDDDIYNFLIIMDALMYYADDYIKQDFADRVLIDNNLKYINGLIIWECLSEASIKVKESFCRNFLQNNILPSFL